MRGFLFFLSLLLLLESVGVKGQTLFGEERIISTNPNHIAVIGAADLDGDGDIDVLSGSYEDRKTVWYKNNGNGIFSTEIVISTSNRGPTLSYCVDLDNDGDIDLISLINAPNIGERIVWYENDGVGNFSEEILISTNAEGLNIADLDGDGDIDLTATYSSFGSEIVWFENDGNGNFIMHTILETNSKAHQTYTEDLDGDGDMDVISVFYPWLNIDKKIVWYENDGSGNFSEGIIIIKPGRRLSSILFKDLDGDGDIDAISTNIYDDEVVWYENNGSGHFSEKIMISTPNSSPDNPNPQHVYATDLDGDEDMDVLVGFGEFNDNKLVWYENNGSSDFSTENIISTNFTDVWKIHAIDLDGDSDMDVISASYEDGTVAWYENLLNDIKITGFTFLDSNENGFFEENENPILNQQMLLTPSVNAVFTNLEGYTHFFVSGGEYQLSYHPNPLWELTSTPETYHITVTDDSELPTYYFGFKPTRILPRVEPHLNSSPTRCNTQSTYWLHYSNTGTTIANGTITLEADELMNFISSNPAPDAIEGRNLIWHFEDLHPSFENQIELQFQMPDFNSMGEILETQASLQLFNENEDLVYSKSTDYNSEVLCSYDPNDKLVRSNLLGQSETAYINDTLLYTVRFQNTGNDVAFNIRIEDYLDKKLDWTTFHPITASHDYRTELNRETGLVTFYFDDIMLPDSTSNEPESHGFVLFGIASLAELEDKTEVENTASIYFDFNPPIVTNTTSTVLIEKVETNIHDSIFDTQYSIFTYPNPFSDYTTIEVEGLPEGNYQLEVMDILGRKVRTLTLEGGETRLERGELESGVYFFQVFRHSLQTSARLEVIGEGKILIN